MATQRRFGDRDTRSDDRYLFLETVMSARARLHLSYIGEGVRDGKPRNPAAPLAELMAALDAAVDETPAADPERATGKARAATAEIDEKEREKRQRPWLVRHPLQPFDARYFDRGDAALFSFNADFAAMRSDPLRSGPGAFVAIDTSTRSADTPPADAIELKHVIAYFKDPAKQLLKNRLNLRLDAVDEGGLRDSEPLEARVEAIDQVAKRLFNDAVARADQSLPDSPPDWLRLTGVLPPGRAGDEAWSEELDKARRLVAAVAQHELFTGGLPRSRPQRVEQAIDLGGAEPVVRGELRRIHERDGALWIMDCYPSRNAERKLDFKQRIGFFLEWALLRLHAAETIPVRACVVIDGDYDDGWQRSFEAWNAQFERPNSSRHALLEDVERRVAGLLEFWQRAQHEPQWYFPATSWALVTHGPDKAREQWAGSPRSKRAERDYAPGYAHLLAGDRDFGAGADLATLQANALHLRSLIDLARPLGDAA
jgi:exodeoxyribonuclease V gamma subunit